jgi:2-polyprenyl-3-methyl-5-hydroxy-6-metoxy-1,4-benzoquinol methylase
MTMPAQQQTRSCWICKSTKTRLWKPRNLDREMVPEDVQITDSRYGVTLTLYRCDDCGFIFAEGSEVDSLLALYEQLVDPNYEEGMSNRALQMQWLIDVGLRHHPNARTVLEIGSGIGLLVREAANRGLDVTGVEPSHSLVAAAQRLNGVKLVQGIFPHPSLQDRKFDVIYVVDVIEHVPDPVGLLASCANALAHGGVLIVVTPDIGSAAARILGHKWWHLRLAHVGYFNSRSMARAASAAGLKIKADERALWFFPVQYLAERLAVYLPVKGLIRATAGLPVFRTLYRQIVPLNLHDSTLFVFTRQTP